MQFRPVPYGIAVISCNQQVRNGLTPLQASLARASPRVEDLQQHTPRYERQRLNGSAARSRGVAVRHHVDRNVRLFLALSGHPVASLGDEPALEVLARLERASPMISASGSK